MDKSLSRSRTVDAPGNPSVLLRPVGRTVFVVRGHHGPAGARDQADQAKTTSATSPERLQSGFFNTFSLYRDGTRVHTGQQWATLELCRFLIANCGKMVPRDELIELLWPDGDDAGSGIHRLHVAVSAARRVLDLPDCAQSVIALECENYGIRDHAIRTDCAQFDAEFTQGRSLLARGDADRAATRFRSALALYKGDYLADHPYADWTHAPRAHYRERRLAALAFLCDRAEQELDFLTEMDLAMQILAADGLREQAHRHLMRAYYRTGERGLAIRQYELCASLLEAEFGVAPSSQTRRLLDAIRHEETLPPE